jgi:AbrB family looped-hinge helix DNA binding protein
MLVKVGSKGQITIPKSYRKSLNITPGDSVIIIESEGQLYLRPVSETIFEMRGIIQVDEPQDLEKVLETTKQIVSRKIAGSENE